MYKIKKAVATAEAGRRVVMVVQEAPQEGEQKSRRAYQNLSNAEVAVDAVGALLPIWDDRLWARGRVG